MHVKEIVSGLRNRRWQVDLFKPSYSDTEVKPGLLGRSVEYFATQVRLWRSRAAGSAIYIRAHPMAFPTALIARILRIPVVQEVNGPYGDVFVTYPELKPVRPFLNAMQRLQYKWASALLPVTNELGQWLHSEARHDRISVLPNAANTDIFRHDILLAADAPEGPYVIFFGGLARWHGVSAMLAATDADEWPASVRLVVIGDGAERDLVLAASQRSRRVCYLGYKPYEELPSYIVGAFAGLCVISDPDGRSSTGLFPLKLFETLACGVPVIVSDFPGQADLIRNCRCGRVVPPDAPKALAMAVAELAHDLPAARAEGMRGAAVVHREHSWDQRASEIDVILTRVSHA